MVHCSQVSDELSLSREDEDDSKVKAMEFFCPHASEVRTLHNLLHSPFATCIGLTLFTLCDRSGCLTLFTLCDRSG